ncbi:MAG: exodeoxyribonuclease V subunit gamma [Candidatus Kapabacteria bacterium]|nr:exodeoxyribonuclease V subunit gamma [Candidatus Kapabacteria bacterium]MDW8012056.1 PD-(D/E)XK nuclease family protein [Bacteroidota bacterium]
MAYFLFNTAAWQQWKRLQHEPWILGEELRVETLLDEAARTDTPERFLCIVPTERRVRWLKRQYFRRVFELHGKSTPEPAVLTLAGFLWTCLGKLFPPGRYTVLSDAHRLALVEDASVQAALSFYRRYEDDRPLPSALLEQLAAVLDGIRRDGVKAAALWVRLKEAREQNDPNVDTARLHDIAAIAQAYEELLGDDLVDEPRGWELLAEQVTCRGSNALKELFPAAEMLLVEGFSAFRMPELSFLQLLATQTLPVVVSIDYSPDNGPLFGNFQELIERLQQAGYTAYATDPPVLMTEQTPAEERIFLPLGAYLRRWLFNTEREIRHPGFSKVITILECRDREEEVRTIARLVKELLCRQRYRPQEIAVVMRQPQRYSALFREIFTQYGIPVNVTDRFWLSQSPVVVAVMSLLELPINGFRRVDLERLVHSPHITLSGPGGEPIDGRNLVAVAARLRIVGGHQFGGAFGWLRQMRSAAEFLRRHLALLEEDPYADPLEREQLQRELAACEQALYDFEALQRRLSWANRRLTPMEFLRLITEEILVGMGIYGSITAAHEQLRNQQWQSTAEWLTVLERVEQEARAVARLTEVTEELVALYQRRWGMEPRPLAEYVQRFATALRGERYQVREKPGAGVTITSIEQTRGIPFRALILCGAVDGEFPLPYQTEVFLGYELPGAEERHRRAERMLFYQFLTNHPEALEQGEQRLFITYPTTEETEQLVRSPFVEELLKVTSLEQDGCVVSVPALLQVFHEGWEGQPPPAFQMLERAPWIVVQGNVAELAFLAWERGQEISELAGKELLLPSRLHPWEPSAVPYPLQLLPELQRRFLERVGVYFSATELELYRRCPYRYFAAHVLRLPGERRPPLELSPIERGLLLHRIVYRFFRELQEEYGQLIATARRSGLPPLRTAPLVEELDAAYERLRRIAQEELQRFQFEHPWFTLEVERLLGYGEQQGILWYWLQSESRRQQQRPGFLPVAFEFGFGMRPTLAEPIQFSSEAWLQGRVDRIELWQEGADVRLGIADYKSGLLRQLTAADVSRGIHLQLPLYLWAVQRILRRDYGLDTRPVFAALYALRPMRERQEAAEYERLLVSTWGRRQFPSVEEVLEQSLGYAQEAVEGIRSALFPVRPYRHTFCRTCPYTALCRIRQLQVLEEEP